MHREDADEDNFLLNEHIITSLHETFVQFVLPIGQLI